MNKSTNFLIGLSVVLAISLIYVIMIPFFTTSEEKEGVRPKDGISVIHSDHIDVDNIAFYFVTTRDPNLIELRFHTNPNQYIIKSAMIAIYFPYEVTLDRTYNTKYVDYSTWYEEDYGNGKMFVKQLICTTKDFDQLKNELKIKNVYKEYADRLNVTAQINAHVAKIYDLTREELEYVLGTFSSKNDDLKQKTREEFEKL